MSKEKNEDITIVPLVSLVSNHYCAIAYQQNDEVKLKEIELEEKK